MIFWPYFIKRSSFCQKFIFYWKLLKTPCVHGFGRDPKRYTWIVLIFILMHSYFYFPCHVVSVYYVFSSLNSPIQDVHNITVYGCIWCQERGNSPSDQSLQVSSCSWCPNTQIAVISGTRRNPVLIRRKPIESCSAIRNDRFFHTCWTKFSFCKRVETRILALETRKTHPKNIVFLIVFGGPGIMCARIFLGLLSMFDSSKFDGCNWWNISDNVKVKQRSGLSPVKLPYCLIQDVHSIFMVCWWYMWHSLGNSWFPKVRLFGKKQCFSIFS